MDDQEIEKRLHELRRTWRVADEPPLNQMWQHIEADAFAPRVRALPARWSRTLLPLAATLVLGFGLGQVAPRFGGSSARPAATRSAETSADLPVQTAASREQPFVGVATDYIERVTGLLVTLASSSRGGKPAEFSQAQARDLLATTRLLMDSPEPPNPHLRGLLEDLELVLAQIVRLPARPDAPDVYLIDQAMDQRDVIPRLRVFLAETPTSQP